MKDVNLTSIANSAPMSRQAPQFPIWKSFEEGSLYMRQGSWREPYMASMFQQHAGAGGMYASRVFSSEEAERIRLKQYAAQRQMLEESRAAKENYKS